MTPDLLAAHYAQTVRLIEGMIITRVPRLPFMPGLMRLTEPEVEAIAARLAAGARLADQRRGPVVPDSVWEKP